MEKLLKFEVSTKMLASAFQRLGVRLHNGMFSVKVWLANGVSCDVAAVEIHPFELNRRGGLIHCPDGDFDSNMSRKSADAWCDLYAMTCFTHH